MVETPIVFYEGRFKNTNRLLLKLTLEGGLTMHTCLRRFEITDEDDPNPDLDADPMRVSVRWDPQASFPREVVLVGTRVAADVFWKYAWQRFCRANKSRLKP